MYERVVTQLGLLLKALQRRQQQQCITRSYNLNASRIYYQRSEYVQRERERGAHLEADVADVRSVRPVSLLVDG